MRVMFVLTSCLLAIVTSVLVAIIGTGIVPFYKPIQKAAPDVSKVSDGKDFGVNVFFGQSGMVDELAKELKAQIERNRAIESDLKAEKEEIMQKGLQIKNLENTLAALRDEVSRKIVQISNNEESNFKKLAEMYSKMEPESASQLLQQSEPDRAAKIISLINDRQAAAILNAAVAKGNAGVGMAAEWTDALRRMSSQKKAQL